MKASLASSGRCPGGPAHRPGYVAPLGLQSRLLSGLATGYWLLATASAHQNAHPKIEAITITKDSLRVEMKYDIPGGDEPKKMRKLFDADQNGQIDATEAEKLLDYIEISCASLVLRLDGKKIYPKRTKRSGGQLEGQVDRANEINFSATFEIALSLSGLHWLELAERGRLKEVPVAVALAAPLLLVAASQSPADFAANRVGPTHIGNQERLSIIFIAPK